MILLRSCIALSIAALPGLAAAQAPDPAPALPALHSGQILRTSDGRSLGQIDHIDLAKGSTSGVASVIVSDRFVYIPTSTITVTPKGAVTSLSLADVRKLR